MSSEVEYLIWVWMNLEKSQTLIGLQFLENVFHWSKFKARSHEIFFTWTFDLLLINSTKFYCLEFIFHNIKEILNLNTNSKGNKSWNKNKNFHLFLILMLKKYCLSKVKTPYEQFLIFLNFMNTFSKAICWCSWK